MKFHPLAVFFIKYGTPLFLNYTVFSGMNSDFFYDFFLLVFFSCNLKKFVQKVASTEDTSNFVRIYLSMLLKIVGLSNIILLLVFSQYYDPSHFSYKYLFLDSEQFCEMFVYFHQFFTVLYNEIVC